MQRISSLSSPCVVSAAIFLAWCAAAVYLGQSILATQRSSQLLQIGAVNGDIFVTHEYWRLLISQFLHVHFFHMLFNAVCIAVVGTALAKVWQWQGLLFVYFIGGTAGQLASVASYPMLVSSGASQALMAVCAVVLLISKSRVRWLALAIVVIQVALDVYVANKIKMGHGIGFAAGLLIAIGGLYRTRFEKRG